MVRKIVVANLLSIVLASVFLIGLLPMSNHMSSIPAMHVDKKMVSGMTAFQFNAAAGNVNDSSELCCDLICPFSIFLVPQTAYAILYGDNKQVVNPDPLIQLIYIESIVPPPKA